MSRTTRTALAAAVDGTGAGVFTVQTSLEVGDPRFGMQSPLTNSTIETPLGLVASVYVGRRA